MNRLKFIDVGKKYGPMSLDRRFYPQDMSSEDIQNDFMNRRKKFGRHERFNGKHIFYASQNNKDGSYFKITNEYVKENQNGWTTIDEDILVMQDDVLHTLIGYPVDDFPVVMIFDYFKNAVSLGYCDEAAIEMRLPMMIVDAIRKAYNSKNNDLIAYISACAGTSIEGSPYGINIRDEIIKQLQASNIKIITMNGADTITNPIYYSRYASNELNDSSKEGMNFVGAVFQTENDVMRLRRVR